MSSSDSLNAMFHDASSFNQDLSSWNVSNVTNFSLMFNGATLFHQDLSGWNTTNATKWDWFGKYSKLSNDQTPIKFR